MSRSRSRNLDQGYRFCPECGRMYQWALQVCPCSVEQIDVAALRAERDAKAKAAQNDQQIYDQAFYDQIIADRLADEISDTLQYEPISRLMQHGERGSGLAGNEPETCEAGGWG